MTSPSNDKLPVRLGTFLQPSHISMELRSRSSSKIKALRPECPICGKVGSRGSVLWTPHELVFMRGGEGHGSCTFAPILSLQTFSCLSSVETHMCRSHGDAALLPADVRSHKRGRGKVSVAFWLMWIMQMMIMETHACVSDCFRRRCLAVQCVGKHSSALPPCPLIC